MVTAADIEQHLEKLAPKELAEDFDNVGLLIGTGSKSVKKVMIMLDADKDTIEEALVFGADLIITHHPVLFEPVKSINDGKLLKLIENKIAVYTAHTNLDSADGGVNDVLAEKLQLSGITELPLNDLKGRMGDVQECGFGEFIGHVKEQLGLKYVRYTGDLNRKVSKIGVLGGSGGEFAPQAKMAGCDVFVTSDVKYHHAQAAYDADICVIDAGHFETENLICQKIHDYLSQKFGNELEIGVSKRTHSYIHYE